MIDICLLILKRNDAYESLVVVRSVKYESQRALKGCTLVIFSLGQVSLLLSH